MHTLAAYFPDRPRAEEQAAAAHFMRGVGSLFPCSECAEDFRHEMDKSPPRTASRAELSMWVCEQHNLVNDKLGKPLFNCDLARLDRRWRFGGEQCEYHMDEHSEPGGGGGPPGSAVPQTGTLGGGARAPAITLRGTAGGGPAAFSQEAVPPLPPESP